MVFSSNSDEANALATKSKKKTDMTPPPPVVFTELEAHLERLSRQLDAVGLSESKSGSVPHEKRRRVPGRFKGVLVVGPEFFEPLTEDELKEFATE
ncbi:hypothetical protein BCY90_01260 [Agrobacterium deltaense]|nr:hypothetical protein L901_01175 [Agrobacterium sp. D14]RKF42986.1 hypothetical protein BCY90_01260 [Agrobacterium deltaense]